jgi:hypothetical protein
MLTYCLWTLLRRRARWGKQREQTGVLLPQAACENPSEQGAERLHLGGKRLGVVSPNQAKPPIGSNCNHKDDYRMSLCSQTRRETGRRSPPSVSNGSLLHRLMCSVPSPFRLSSRNTCCLRHLRRLHEWLVSCRVLVLRATSSNKYPSKVSCVARGVLRSFAERSRYPRP